jgi:hypothetical protein
VFIRNPERTVTYEDEVKEDLIPYLDQYERLGELLLAIEYVLKRRPEDKETAPIDVEGRNLRYITRYPAEELDIPLPKIQLLYEYTEDEVIFWAVRVEEP